MSQLTLVFPFTIDNKETSYSYETNIERKENIISFSLKYKFDLHIEDGVIVEISKFQNQFLYVLQFEDLNKAIDFLNVRKCNVLKKTNEDNTGKLQEEISKFMLEYEDKERSQKKNKRKRILVEDEDGFMKYV